MNSIYIGEEIFFNTVFSSETKAYLAKEAGLDTEKCYSKEDIFNHGPFDGVDVLFSSWRTPILTKEEISHYFPDVRALFYSAGSVRYFAAPYLELGITVVSGWAANAVPVAEYTVSQIILSGKNFFSTSRLMHAGQHEECEKFKANLVGNFGSKIGIIGAGMIGRLVISLLKNHKNDILVFDPFLPDKTAETLGVSKCTLPEIFSECNVITNHLANNEQTRGILTYDLFARMRPYSTFINTGRGAQVDEDGLARVLRERPDLTALLDVTVDEPPKASSPFYGLENCILTPHIAGSKGNELFRISEFIADEYTRWRNGEPLKYSVSCEMLKTMA